MNFSVNDSRVSRLMLRKSRITLRGFLVTALLLGGCASTPIHYYNLVPQSGQVHTSLAGGGIQPIEVLSPSVPELLDRDTMVRSVHSYRVEMVSGAAWSEPLGTLIGHTLAADLGQRLPGRVIFSQNDAVTTPPKAVLALSISRFDVDGNGYAVIEGILSVRRGNGFKASTRDIPVKWTSSHVTESGPNALAASLSEGIGVIADQAAQLCEDLETMPSPS
ncbi:hypothetical protein GS501_00875 [Saccharibacter sp. 17.LH.SD]|uniref:PqiC family protein n=1 Tax=Saccharibacter sp. 17.LH.SD TaxID=2689393 RepID=UPI00136FF872|nr:PqiC family protein [Saccharibacter sp. 17.LH.SD]MXV43631.1 hypothetical protein [Saccharibacter sp. 17.LH.SD]